MTLSVQIEKEQRYYTFGWFTVFKIIFFRSSGVFSDLYFFVEEKANDLENSSNLVLAYFPEFLGNFYSVENEKKIKKQRIEKQKNLFRKKIKMLFIQLFLKKCYLNNTIYFLFFSAKLEKLVK